MNGLDYCQLIAICTFLFSTKILNAWEQQLKDGERTLTTEQIKQIGKEIETLQPELAEIAEQAKLQIILSQMRAEIADKVVELLESYGYQLTDPDGDAAYEGSDYCNAYVVKVKNIAGEEIVTDRSRGLGESILFLSS
ncbi:hypothetical protein MEN41_13430 [Dolichospermum sp. ST_con]|nr:hypothetical protein [Dolichospermum sp. ST_con]MDD1417776.1 hypothetical protein [Dolichospermum sp. ST_sed1]MDD1423434.1 hypothetical protein [Dolichospermum sp. ST_sed9]MDD1431210.1 hypothetical protein [Dolichospermum sp. ST_sed6]MDD1435685.1 hypothetical protein [Dolichospermum sp. ST_sed10]MDD1440654.1 hypothetical protein [Dolichospermum sp. ST_sed3]MDD1446595.1 hypothetical protein [Dolichospermum sp. ST_sed8]MDD1455449.1 hypothetical protein [Dolichospermum sp. ST_sed7]MDD146063